MASIRQVSLQYGVVLLMSAGEAVGLEATVGLGVVASASRSLLLALLFCKLPNEVEVSLVEVRVMSVVGVGVA